jgi:hypothetical protein
VIKEVAHTFKKKIKSNQPIDLPLNTIDVNLESLILLRFYIHISYFVKNSRVFWVSRSVILFSAASCFWTIKRLRLKCKQLLTKIVTTLILLLIKSLFEINTPNEFNLIFFSYSERSDELKQSGENLRSRTFKIF